MSSGSFCCAAIRLNEPRPDYGYDIVITTYDFEGDPEFKSGTSENGLIYIQLKATDHLNVLADGETISFQIKRRHAVHWEAEPMPIYLVVYSVKDNQAYWLHMQPYLKSSGFTMPPEEQTDVTVHLSRHFVLDEKAIDLFRQMKQEILAQVGRLKLYEQT